MFPSMGYFKDLFCPDTSCVRPHCPFYHDPNPPSSPPRVPSPSPLQSSWPNPSYNPETYTQYYAHTPTFSGYSASVAAAPAVSAIYSPRDPPSTATTPGVGYNGYVASAATPTVIPTDAYDPGSSGVGGYVPSYVPTPVEVPMEPVGQEEEEEAPAPESPPREEPTVAVERNEVPKEIKKEIKMELDEEDEIMIIGPPPKVKAEPLDEDDVPKPQNKKKKEPLPLPKLPPNITSPPKNILEAAKSVAEIDAEIERLMQLREQKKKHAVSLTTAAPEAPAEPAPEAPEEKKKKRKEVVQEYVPKVTATTKPEKRKASAAIPAYTPTPLAEIERQKEEKRKRSEEQKRGGLEGKRKYSSDVSEKDLFGEDAPYIPSKKQRTDSSNSTTGKPSHNGNNNAKEKIALLKESRPAAAPKVPPLPAPSSSSSKTSVITPEQVAAAKLRVARATNIIRPVSTNKKVASAVEQMKARMVAAEKLKEQQATTSTAAASKTPRTMEERFGEKRAVPKGETRTARTSQVSGTAKKPSLQEPTNPKVPMTIRLQYLNKMHQEFLTFLPPDDAKTQAEEEEKAVLDKVKHRQGYAVAIINALKRIRDIGEGKTPHSSNKISHEQVILGKAYGNITVNAKGPKDNAPVTEDRLYAALEDGYLLSEEQLKTNSYPIWETSGKVHIEPSPYDKKRCKKTFVPDYELDRVCCRCTQEYTLDLKGKFVKANCIYHLKGKSRVPGKRRNNEARYPCCGSDDGVAGCQAADTHVCDTLRESELKKFVSTPEPSGPNDPRNKKIYALDCEMVYTVWGPALARITVVDFHEAVVFDEIVKPAHTVVDYNTTFSGITANQLETATYDLAKVHERFFELVNSESILIGHSLESDLKAMRVVHDRVVDTSVLYPHRIDDQKKRGLRELCLDKLGKSIQDDIDGHDSKEDSIAALQLVIWKTKFDGKV